MPDHDKRVALVSGANRGLGLAISQGLAEHEITVILGARDSKKGAHTGLSPLQNGAELHDDTYCPGSPR